MAVYQVFDPSDGGNVLVALLRYPNLVTDYLAGPLFLLCIFGTAFGALYLFRLERKLFASSFITWLCSIFLAILQVVNPEMVLITSTILATSSFIKD